MTTLDVLDLPHARLLLAAVDAPGEGEECVSCGARHDNPTWSPGDTCLVCGRQLLAPPYATLERERRLLCLLADVLEEEDDPRAAGLRTDRHPDGTVWRHTDVASSEAGDLLGHVFDRLDFDVDAGDRIEHAGGHQGWRIVSITYRSRSAAFLALAAALTESAS